MKKVISVFLVIITLFNFIFGNIAFASDDSSNQYSGITENSFSDKSLKELINGQAIDKNANGKTVGQEIKTNLINTVLGGAIVGTLAIVLDIVPMIMQLLMTVVAYDGQPITEWKLITIEDMVFNKIDLFKINYLDFNSSNSISSSMKESVAEFYYICRLIAVAFSLLSLIYVGIRMALSLTSEDKAKYKKMFTGWIESVVLLFTMQYIIAIMLKLGSISSDIVTSMYSTSTSNSFEREIMDSIYSVMFLTTGWEYCVYSIMFWVLVFIQTKFFLAYIKRFITVGFLIIVAPLVTMIYPIDKAGDGKAQSFNSWFNELSVNIFLQPIHGIIYLVFMNLAGEIAKTSNLFAMVFLFGLTKVEKIVVQLFNIRGQSLHLAHEQRKKG